MDKKQYRIQIGETVYKYSSEKKYIDIVKETTEDYRNVILIKMNGVLRELEQNVSEDGTLEFVRKSEFVGYLSYVRTATFIMLKAIYDLGGHNYTEHAISRFPVDSGIYFTIDEAVEISDEFISNLKRRMKEIVEQDIVIQKRSIGTGDAVKLFKEHCMPDKARLFRYRRASRVNIYSIDDYDDYFYGYMAYSTGFLGDFDIQKYDEGFILVLPKRGEEKAAEIVPEKKLFAVQKESLDWEDKLQISTVGELNDKISHEGPHNLILIQEALQEAKITRIAEDILDRENIKFVMIAGPSSSGKTSFSHRLSIQLAAHGMTPYPIAMDNYFKNREDTPVDENGEKDYECLEAIDVAQFNRDMTDLLEGKRVELPVFNFKTGQREYRGDFLQLKEGDILVIEGIHGLNEKLSYTLPKESKYKIYIAPMTQLNIDEHNSIPTTDSRLIRRLTRDARTRGTSAAETIKRWPSVRRGEEKYIYPFQGEADAMFNSSLIYELASLKVYAEPLLFGIDADAPEYIEAKRLLKFFDYFLPIPSEEIPHNSLLREFVGGSAFPV